MKLLKCILSNKSKTIELRLLEQDKSFLKSKQIFSRKNSIYKKYCLNNVSQFLLKCL